MAEHSFFQNFRQIMPESAQTWVVTAMRYTPLIWQSLQEPAFAQRAFLNLATDPYLWTPGRLAILSLDITPSDLNLSDPGSIPLDSQLLRRARQALEKHAEASESSGTALERLQQVGWITLYLNDRHRKQESWENILVDILKRNTQPLPESRTVLACLYSISADRENLIDAILKSNASYETHALALSTLVSNPLPQEEVEQVIINLLKGDKRCLKPEWVQTWLGVNFPRLAVHTAGWLLEQDKAPTDGEYSGQTASLLAEIRSLSWQAFLHRQSNAPVEALEFLEQARKQTKWLVSEIAAAWAEQAEGLVPDYTTAESVSEAWEQAIRSAPVPEEDRQQLPYFASHIQAQVRQGNLPEAFLSTSAWQETKFDGATLFEISQQKLSTGEIESAGTLAGQALSMVLETESSFYSDEKLLAILQKACDIFSTLDMPEKVVQSATRILQITPANYRALQFLGRAYQQIGEKQLALQAFEAAFLLAPEQLDLHRLLTASLEENLEWESALFERNQIAQLSASTNSPEYPEDLHHLARCAYQSGALQQAVEACMHSLQIEPSDWQAHTILGKVFSDLGDYVQAQDHFNQAVQAAPQQIEPWLRLASLYEQNNEPEKSSFVLSEAIQANPNKPELHLAYGKYHLERDALTLALNSFQCSYDLAIQQPELYQDLIRESGIHLSSTLARLGQVESSRNIITPIYQQYPKDPVAARAYAQTMVAMREYEAAISPLVLALQSQPKDPALTLDYGKALLALGREPETALRALQNTLAAWPAHLETQALLAEATAATGDNAKALEMFRDALESELGKDSHWQSRLSMGLGLAALALGRTETALAALQEAIQIEPQNSTAQRALAETFMAVGLHNEGWITAQTALRLDPDVDTSIWFADLALSWYKKDFAQEKTTPRSQSFPTGVHIRPEQILQEAATALHQAHKLFPSEPRILVKLSQVLIQAGDHRGARSCLREIVNLSNPTLEALEDAATMLLELKDPSTAAECLEKALKLAHDGSPAEQARRYTHLANARQQAGHIASAIQALEQALLLVPDQAGLYHQLVNLWISMGNLERALETMDRARQLVKEPLALAELQITTSLLCRKAGRLLAALDYAEKAMNTCAEISPSNKANSLRDRSSALYADLSWALLRPEEAQRSLRCTSNLEPDKSNHLEYFCLGAELALQLGEEVEAANYLIHALDLAADHPWPLAIQARLLYKQKDQPLAVSTLQDAIERAKHEKLPVTAFISLAFAAAEMKEWQPALDSIRRAVTQAPDEPLPQLSLAQLLVERAEFQLLCEDLEVIKHAPGRETLSLESQEEYLAALQTTETALLQAFQEKNQLPEAPPSILSEEMDPWNKAFAQIARWKCRGAAAFSGPASKVPASWISWSGFPLTIGDEVAQLAYLRRESGSDKSSRSLVATAREVAVLHPQEPRIQIQASLALASANLNEALRYARSAANMLNALPKYPLTALAHTLVAHLAFRAGDIPSAAQSIHISLGIWSGEARWHNLTARILLASMQEKSAAGDAGAAEDLNSAIAHLEEAVRLEPTRASHAILLSQVIFQTANQDPGALKRALRILEKTSRITGHEPEIWLALAAAYQQLGGKTNLKLAYASAERAVTVAREANGRQALIDAHIQLGQMALSNAEPEEAYRQARQALRIDAYHPDAILLQVQALEALDRIDDALEVIDKALPNTKDNMRLQIKRGTLLSRSPDPTLGLSALESLANQYPNQPAVHSALAKNLYRIGRKEDAILHAQQALQQSSTHESPLDANEIGEMHTLLGNLYNELGHLDQAIYQFNTALQQHPEHIDAYLALAETYHKQRQFLKAQEVLDQAISAAPTDPRPYYQAGMAYKDGRNYEAAANMLRKAAQLSPHDINIRKQLAAVMAIVVLNNTRNLGNKVADEVR